MTEFRSRAVRSLVELHERELRAFHATWTAFRESGKPLPEALGDPDYESPALLVTHVQAAARSYMLWIREVLGDPVPDLERIRDADLIVPRLEAFMEETLDGWRRHLLTVADEQLGTQAKSRWGEPFTIDQMLEHAVVHPMRHRLQLERILAS